MANPLKTACEDMITRATSVADIACAAMWNNQVQKVIAGTGDVFDAPAVFIEPVFGAQQNLGLKVIQADLTWRLHIVHEQIATTPDQTLVVMALRDDVKKAFMGYRPTHCSGLQYVTEKADTDHGNMYHYTIDFTCAFIDTKGSPLDPDATDWIIKEPPTDIEINIDKENQL